MKAEEMKKLHNKFKVTLSLVTSGQEVFDKQFVKQMKCLR